MYLLTLATATCHIFWIDNFGDGWECYGWNFPNGQALLDSGMIDCGFYGDAGQAWRVTPVCFQH